MFRVPTHAFFLWRSDLLSYQVANRRRPTLHLVIVIFLSFWYVQPSFMPFNFLNYVCVNHKHFSKFLASKEI